MNNYDVAAGLGFGFIILSLVIYVGLVALTLWIGYLIIRTAVKNGILRADEERAARRPGGGYSQPGGGYGPPPTNPR